MVRQNEAPASPSALDRWWRIWFVATLGVAFAYMLSWLLRHPLPEGWDETRFVIRMHRDARIFAEDGLVEGVKALLVHYRMREPGFRIAAVPLTAVVDAAPFALRAWSVLQCFTAAGLLFFTVRPAAGSVAAMVATAVPLMSPALKAVGVRVYTDPAIYLAVAASLFFLSRTAMGRGRRPVNALGLGLSLAFGALSKLTFGLVLGPLIVAVLVARRWRPLVDLDWPVLMIGCVIGGVLATPHYVLNLRYWLDHVASSASGTWSLPGDTLVEKVLSWLQMMGLRLVGVPLLVPLVVAAALWLAHRQYSPGRDWSPSERLLLAGGLAGSVPLVLAHATGDSGIVRLVTPVLFPLACALGVAVNRARMASPPADRAILAAFALGTALMAASGVMAAQAAPPHWDWDRLHELVNERIEGEPTIGFFGRGTEMNLPQLEYPWAMRNQPAIVVAIPPPDDLDVAWSEIEDALETMDVVVVVVDEQWGDEAANRFNVAFAQRLQRSPMFAPHETIRFDSGDRLSDVRVYFRSAGAQD